MIASQMKKSFRDKYGDYAEIILNKKGKHLNEEFGYKKFPLLLIIIKTFITKNPNI